MIATELRIGNLVSAKSPEMNEWIEGHPIDIHDLHFLIYPKSKSSIKVDLKPIPLTKRWLLKFGFEKFKCANTVYRLRLTKHFQLRARAYYVDGEEFFNITLPYHYPMPDIDKVHLLQNLYRSLRGKELTIK